MRDAFGGVCFAYAGFAVEEEDEAFALVLDVVGCPWSGTRSRISFCRFALAPFGSFCSTNIRDRSRNMSL